MTDDIEEIAGVRFGPDALRRDHAARGVSGLIQRMDSDDRRNPYRLTGLGSARCARGSRACRR